jgi:DNA-binding transcriptional LysR family regulator
MPLMSNLHNFNRFDLNLLFVFDAIFAERSVTKAAGRLSVTQTAVSHSLSRLREQFGDRLFLRVPGGVRPTPRALELAPAIRETLEQVEYLVAKSEFDPAVVSHTFRIAITEYFGSLALPQLVRRLEREAPNIELVTVPNILINVPLLLDSHEIDFAIGYFQDPLRNMLPPRLKSIPVMKDHYVCVMRKNHPFARGPLTLEKYLSARHLLISLRGESFGVIDKVLKRMKARRRIGLTICHHMVGPPIIQGSDMIMTLTSRMALQYKDLYDLHVAPLPIKIPASPMQLVWNSRVADSAIHSWMRSLIVDVCARV